jgi:hypothetical protein
MASHGVTALRRLHLRHEIPAKMASHGVTALRRLDLGQATAVCGQGIGCRKPPAGGHPAPAGTRRSEALGIAATSGSLPQAAQPPDGGLRNRL